ncbi:MAG: low molecular weight phosphatase family protein [Thioploca sp.]|nr:low molecular weight phosphatase family protein [Thioploca sp.]
MPTQSNNKILFLCTGNYYRSRFAQHLFNALANNKGLNWQAESRGLAIERGFNNIGAISPHAIKGLKERGLSVPADERLPLQATDTDFAIANKVIVLDKEEHHPIMLERFPQWIEKVEYWMVHDLDKIAPAVALRQIEYQLLKLINSLKNQTIS